MERVVARENTQKAYARVVRNKGGPGIDKMTVSALKAYLQANWPAIKEQLVTGTYRPKPVKRVAIPKPGGGVRVALINIYGLQRVRGLPPDEIARIHRNVYLIALAIPAISVFGVVFAGAMKARDNRRLLRQGYGREEVQRMVAEPEERPAPNWWILGGSLLFVVFTLTVGLNPLPYNEEIVFAGSMAIVVFLIDGSRASLSPTRARRSSVPRS